MNHGYTINLTEMHHGSGTKFYKIYEISNEARGEHRLLYNWGRMSGVHNHGGQFKIETNGGYVALKVSEKYIKGYAVVKRGEPVTVQVDYLLRQAGIDVNVMPSTPVESVAVDSWTLGQLSNSIGQMITDLNTKRFDPDMIVRHAELRSAFQSIRTELDDAEGRMEILAALVHRRFEESS